MSEEQPDLIDLTTQIVAAYVGSNQISMTDLPGFIASVHGALRTAGAGVPEPEPSSARATAAQIRKSITPDALISFEDGRPYKTLKRHLTKRGLTLAEYRAKWGLPDNYPSTAPTYSAQRSAFAQSIGLGQIGGRKKKPPVRSPAKPRPKK